MRLIDLLDEGLKRCMDKLVEKERHQVRGRWGTAPPAALHPTSRERRFEMKIHSHSFKLEKKESGSGFRRAEI